MSSFFSAGADVHSNDPNWGDWEEIEPIVYMDTPPPADVLTVQDADGDHWTREGDRWFCSFQWRTVAFGHDGSTSEDVKVLREWWEIQVYGPFTETS